MPIRATIANFLRRLLFAAVLTGAFAGSATAELLVLKRDALSDADWADVKVFILKKEPLLIEFISERERTNRTETLDIIRRLTIFTGKFDLNGDGTKELLVLITHSALCGSAGCTMLVYEMKTGHWSQIADKGSISRDKLNAVPIFDDRSRYYPRSHPEHDRLKKLRRK